MTLLAYVRVYAFGLQAKYAEGFKVINYQGLAIGIDFNIFFSSLPSTQSSVGKGADRAVQIF